MACMRDIWQTTVLLFMASPAFSGEAVYDRALFFYSKADYANVIKQLDASATDSRSLALLGQAYIMSAEFRRATGTLERAVALDPDNSMIQDWLGRAYARRAENAFPVTAMSLAIRARGAFEEAVRLNPANGEAVDDLFEFYLQAPGILGGGIDKARGLLPLIEAMGKAEGHYARARILEQRKDFDRAETEFRRAMEAEPSDIGRMIDLARFLADHGRLDESDLVFRRAEKAHPESPKLMYARAECWIHGKRNLEQARQLLRRYLTSTELTPEDVPRAEVHKLMKKAFGN